MESSAALEVPQEVPERSRTEKSMSNCGHAVDDGLEADLRAGMTGSYYGWNFCCDYVWFAEGQFHAAVLRYHQLQEIVSAATLEDLMRQVSDSYGWD